MKFEDLTGKRFGRLSVIKRSENKGGKVYWECQCECGNYIIVAAHNLKNSHVSSCGCYRKEKSHEHTIPIDLTGKTFGLLEVDRFSHHKNNLNYWLCRCSCGNLTFAHTNELQNGRKKSCGCQKGYKSIDLTGRKFCKLTVLNRNGYYTRPNGDKLVKWHCICECGNECDVIGSNLLSGETKSCGCLHSKGESDICKALDKLHINYYREYTFPNSEISNLRYDFAVISGQNVVALIEYDGIQHYKPTKFHNCSDEQAISDFSSLIIRDWKKSLYAFEENIPLLRIRYDDKCDIDKRIINFLEQKVDIDFEKGKCK